MLGSLPQGNDGILYNIFVILKNVVSLLVIYQFISIYLFYMRVMTWSVQSHAALNTRRTTKVLVHGSYPYLNLNPPVHLMVKTPIFILYILKTLSRR